MTLKVAPKSIKILMAMALISSIYQNILINFLDKKANSVKQSIRLLLLKGIISLRVTIILMKTALNCNINSRLC